MATDYCVLRHATERIEEGDGELRSTHDEPIPNTFTVLVDSDGEPAIFSAPNDIAAIKAAEAEIGMKFDHGAVAVPLRSWRPRMPEEKLEPRRLWS